MRYVAVLAILVCVAGAALAVPVLDQAQPVESGLAGFGGTGGSRIAQTFVAGKTGLLHHVDVGFRTESADATELSIRTTASGIPTETVLGSAVLASLVVGWNTIDLASEGIFMTAGTPYALALTDLAAAPVGQKDLGVQWDPAA
ncbi:hypothetical protein ACFL09_03905, partial [Planctomycetota bacterium]